MHVGSISAHCFFFWLGHSDSVHRQTKKEGKTIRLVQSILLVVLYILSALHVSLDWWFPAHIFQTDGASPLLEIDFLADLPVFFLVIEGMTLAFSTAITDSISVSIAFLVASVASTNNFFR